MPTANGAAYVPDQPETSYYDDVAGRRPAAEPARTNRAANYRQPVPPAGPPRPRVERGLPGWMAVLLLIAVAGVSGIIDSANGSAIRGAFNYRLVLASLLAIL